MEAFAEMIAKEIGHHTAKNMTKTDRFCFYKIGPVISVNVSSIIINSSSI